MLVMPHEGGSVIAAASTNNAESANLVHGHPKTAAAAATMTETVS